MRSVYQVYETGRGADLSWVMYTGPSRTDHKDWPRIEAAATDLKVGIVHMPKPTAPAAWVTQVSGYEREPSMKERQSFLDRLGLTTESFDEQEQAVAKRSKVKRPVRTRAVRDV